MEELSEVRPCLVLTRLRPEERDEVVTAEEGTGVGGGEIDEQRRGARLRQEVEELRGLLQTLSQSSAAHGGLSTEAAELMNLGIERARAEQVVARARALSSGQEADLRPALRAIFPALTSQFILLMLSSAVVSVISADDLTSVAANLQSQTFRSFEIYIVVTLIYLTLALSFSALFKLIYQRVLNYPDRR